ncbi:MAG: lysostaphin resistance A-like protein [Gammaproteobacteria bacterium]
MKSAASTKVFFVNKNVLKGFALAVLLLLSVYVPSFVLVSVLRPPLVAAVPLVIFTSLVLALLIIAALRRRWGGWRSWGFDSCSRRYLVWAAVLGIPIGLVLTFLSSLFPATGPLSGLKAALWLQVVYFIVAAPIQEEIIFRGLIQTTLTRHLQGTFSLAGMRFSIPAVSAALLFGLIHLGVNPLAAIGAFVLGLLAGELRQRSGSLLPAILVHAIFNASAMVWMFGWFSA